MNLVALVKLHGDLAVLTHLNEVGELVAPDIAGLGHKHDVERTPGRFILRQRHDGGDAFIGLQRQQIDKRLAARLRGGEGELPHLHFVGHAARGEEQHRGMGIDDEHAGDEIFIAGRHSSAALAAAALCPVGRERHAFDVALVRHGHDHVFARNQIFVIDLRATFNDFGAARRSELFHDLGKFVFHDADYPFAGA